jgi:hypothetical protein
MVLSVAVIPYRTQLVFFFFFFLNSAQPEWMSSSTFQNLAAFSKKYTFKNESLCYVDCEY